MTPDQAESLNASLAQSEPRDILARVFEELPNCTLAFSGAEDVVLVAMAVKLNPDVKVFTLDTGRLHPETYKYLETVRETYGIELQMLSPDAVELQRFVAAKGLYSFYQDGHEECCGIRKVAPLRKHLAGFDAWISGMRRDQSPLRTEVPVVAMDTSFSSEGHPVIKVNPLANWSSEQVWNYIRMLEIPYNPLHDKGYLSIGCEPCTKPVGPGQHEREGRWWWEEATIKECGLHKENLKLPD